MPGERKPISRAESQQRTREEVLDAAEEMFLAHGFHGTTVAKIAAAAGRTAGALYANFDSKENLCVEVLMRCYTRMVAQLVGGLTEGSGTPDAQIESVAAWWQEAIRDESLVALTGEYFLAVHKNPDQRRVAGTFIETSRAMLASILSDSFAPGSTAAEREASTKGLMATSMGLALGRAFGIYGDDEAGELMGRALRMWTGGSGSATPDGR